MTSNIRLVTSLPADPIFANYEPFEIKGQYGVQLIEQPDPKEFESLLKKITICQEKGHSAGIFKADQRPKALIWTIKENLFTPGFPQQFDAFISFSLAINIQIFALIGETQTLSVSIQNQSSLNQASQQMLAESELFGGISNHFQSPEERKLWLAKVLESQKLEPNHVIHITSHPEIVEQPQMPTFVLQDNFPTHDCWAVNPTKDCSFISLLLFGRSLSNIRGSY